MRLLIIHYVLIYCDIFFSKSVFMCVYGLSTDQTTHMHRGAAGRNVTVESERAEHRRVDSQGATQKRGAACSNATEESERAERTVTEESERAERTVTEECDAREATSRGVDQRVA